MYKLLLCVLTGLFFSGCLNTYYPGIWGSRPFGTIVKSDYRQQRNSYYLSADIGNPFPYNDSERNLFIRGRIVRVSSNENINFNAALGIYSGIYSVKGITNYKPELPNYNQNYSYYGAEPSANLLLNFKFGGFKLGLGFETSIFLEFGSFYNFRKEASLAGVASCNTSPVTFGFSTYPYLAWEFDNGRSISFQMNVGLPGIISPGLVYNDDKISYWFSYFPNMGIYNKLGTFQTGVAVDLRLLNF